MLSNKEIKKVELISKLEGLHNYLSNLNKMTSDGKDVSKEVQRIKNEIILTQGEFDNLIKS